MSKYVVKGQSIEKIFIAQNVKLEKEEMSHINKLSSQEIRKRSKK